MRRFSPREILRSAGKAATLRMTPPRRIALACCHQKKAACAGRLSPNEYPQNPGLSLRPGEWAVLEVVLQDPRGQRGAQGASVVINRAHDFSAAYHFGRRQSGNFLREHKIDFQLRVGLQSLVALKEHSGAAY